MHSVSADPYVTISAALSGDAIEPLRGHVDVFDPEAGIEGWAVDLDEPERPLVLELIVSDVVVATASTRDQREDIATMLGCDVRPGFKFPDNIFDRLFRMARDGGEGKIAVRIAGTAMLLPSSGVVPTLAELERKRRDAGLSGAAADFNLLIRLSALRADAAALAAKPLRPLPDQQVGFIEAMAVDSGGCVWVVGWMRRGVVADCPVVIVDRQKIPAGFAYTLYDRPDLDVQSCGVVGVLYSDWRPTTGAGVFVYLGETAKAHLRATDQLRIVGVAEFAEHFSQVLSQCHTGHSASLRQLLTRPDSWAIAGQSVGFASSAALEKVLVLPGFGALIAGWAISPLKPISGFALRMGAAILSCDPDSLFFTARPDLAGLYPGGDRLVERAGFVGAFRGALSASDLVNPVLKVIYADGSASNHLVEPKLVQRLAGAEGLRTAAEIYPSLNSELFFPAFSAALREDVRESIRPCRPYVVSYADSVFVFVVPDDRSDMFLMFAEAEDRLRRSSGADRFVFIAGQTRFRPEIVSLFSALKALWLGSHSLFFADDIAYALYGLPQVLATVGASAFVFVAAGVYLTQPGWDAAAAALDEGATTVSVFEITDAAGANQGGALSAECFAWSTRAFGHWIGRTPVFIGGQSDCNPLASAANAPVAIRGGARRSLCRVASPLVRAVNQLAVVA